MVFSLAGCRDKDDDTSDSSLKVDESPIVSEPSAEETSDNGDESAIGTISLSQLDTEAQGWGQGNNVDEDNRPISCTEFQEKYGKYDTLFIEESSKKDIYITIDQGYENGYTEQVLDVLKEKEVSVVFFLTYDYVSKNQDLVQRMIDEGHTIGNHSYGHLSMPSLSIDEQQGEINKLHDYVNDEFSYEMTLFRPPEGVFSEQSLAVTQSLGYKSIFWSFAYVDWDPDNQMNTDEALEKLTSKAHSGAIYLLHNTGATNATILGDFIDNMIDEGYTFGVLK